MPRAPRFDPVIRKTQILDVTMELSRKHGYTDVTKQMITDRIGTSATVVNRYYGTMNQLRRDIVRHAIANQDLTIIGQALVAKDPYVRKVPADLRKRAIVAFAANL